MEALKIVCKEYDNKLLKDAKNLIKKEDLFLNKLDFINTELNNIVWAIRKPINKEDFNELYNNLEDNNVNKLYNKLNEIRNKYKNIFVKLNINNPECVYNESMLLGTIGTLANTINLYKSCHDNNLETNTIINNILEMNFT